jgi:L-methionine (R)-S-oxide reductase
MVTVPSIGYGAGMFDFTPSDAADKPLAYRELRDAADAITRDEPDAIANMANVAALIWAFLPDLNWAGFYRNCEDSLILGPFMGRPACIRIPLGKGVCGTAAGEGRSILVEDVHAFPGHIACDAASRSELVVPVMRDDRVIAIIDCDSPRPARFDEEDRQGLEALAALLASRI